MVARTPVHIILSAFEIQYCHAAVVSETIEEFIVEQVYEANTATCKPQTTGRFSQWESTLERSLRSHTRYAWNA